MTLSEMLTSSHATVYDMYHGTAVCFYTHYYRNSHTAVVHYSHLSEWYRMKSTKPVVTVTANRFVNKKQADRHGGRTAVFTLARHICSRESFEAVDGCQRKFRYCIPCTAVQGLPKRCLGQAFHTVNMSESDAKPSE